MTVVIFRGISGAGKTSLVKILEGKDEFFENVNNGSDLGLNKSIDWAVYMLELRVKTKHMTCISVSADNYFTDDKGVYNFNPRMLSEAHSSCLMAYNRALDEGDQNTLLIVDNTNCTVAEVAPYATLAQTYRQELKIVTLIADPRECAKRNLHKVPSRTIMLQHLKLEDSLRDFPPWWPQEIFFH